MEEFLEEIGLSKYADRFAEAEIDLDALALLEEADLKELGLPIGPRLKLRKAIADFAAKVAAAVADQPETLPATGSAERRQMSVMFVDLVGYTEMMADVDPEEMGGILNLYQKATTGVVAELDGHVANFMGDGVMCYFGWPRAHEDDAERAVHAARRIVERVQAIQVPGGRACCRVGIATGLVVVGDAAGDGVAAPNDVVGETPNIAARLQTLAEPDQIVISAATRALIGDVFEVTALGGRAIKGYAEAMEVFAVGAERQGESRFAALRGDTLDAMIGRHDERAMIVERWRAAVGGHSHFVLVTGEAGIGKSRIVSETVAGLPRGEAARIVCQCSPYHTESAFYPIMAALQRAADFDSGEADALRLEKIESLDGLAAEDVPLLATLLGVDTAGRYPPLDLSPNQLRARLLTALIRLTLAQATERPLLFVFEDLHWIDPTSLEFLDLLLDAITDKRIMVLATARPDFSHGFGGHPAVSRFALNRLGRPQVEEMVTSIAQGRRLPEEVVSLIAERTDGVPLFIEELTKTILESSDFRPEGGRLVLSGKLDATAIPTTLNDSLMARLDRQTHLKEAAQLGACIGREFEHALLVAISPLPEQALLAALDGLIGAELIYRRGVVPEASYVFKHALVRDAAYDSLLRRRRRTLHARILATLEKRPDIAPEVLAHHAEAAGEADRAVELWDSASKLALARPAFDEAIAHMDRALALVERDLDTAGADAARRALPLRLTRGVTMLARRGYSSVDSQQNFQHALRLADMVGDTPLRFPIIYGLWVGEYTRAEYRAALTRSETAIELAEQSGDSAARQVAAKLRGLTLCLLGRNLEAAPVLDHSMELFDPVAHDGLETRFGQDLACSSHCYIMINSLLLGRTARAERHGARALVRAERAEHANTTCYVHTHLAFKALMLRDRVAFQRHAALNAGPAVEHNLGLWRAYVDLFAGLEEISVSGAAGLEVYLDADRRYTAGRDRVFLTLIRQEATWRALEAGLTDGAATLAAMNRALIEETDERFGVVELLRLDAAVARAAGDADGAEAHLRAALAEAEQRGSHLSRLRAACDLAGLLPASARAVEGEATLRAALAEIDDGDCLPERAAAAQFLADVGAGPVNPG